MLTEGRATFSDSAVQEETWEAAVGKQKRVQMDSNFLAMTEADYVTCLEAWRRFVDTAKAKNRNDHLDWATFLAGYAAAVAGDYLQTPKKPLPLGVVSPQPALETFPVEDLRYDTLLATVTFVLGHMPRKCWATPEQLDDRIEAFLRWHLGIPLPHWAQGSGRHMAVTVPGYKKRQMSFAVEKKSVHTPIPDEVMTALTKWLATKFEWYHDGTPTTVGEPKS